MSNESPNHELDSLVDQLKTSSKHNKVLEQKAEKIGLAPSEVEEFVIQNSGHLVQQSLEVMENVKDYIMASGDPDSISSLADLIKASSNAIESLNKIVVQNKRSATTLASKTMDVEAKCMIENKKTDPNALIGTREEIFKKILDQANVIDLDEEDTNLDSADR